MSTSRPDRTEFVVIVDIDGTLANNDHRLGAILTQPKDWDAFFAGIPDDKPIQPVIRLVQMIASNKGVAIVYVSGRPKRTFVHTYEWMRKHQLPHGSFYMREDGDHRPDDQIKRELLDLVRSRFGRIDLAIDDRSRVVKMWRDNGITCLQCDDGDF